MGRIPVVAIYLISDGTDAESNSKEILGLSQNSQLSGTR